MPIIIYLLVIIPIWLMPIDFWDGRILDYALATHDYSSFKTWLLDNRWYLEYWLDLLLGITSHYRIAIKLISSIAIAGLAYEVYLYSGRNKLAACFALCFPAWHTLTTSVMLIFILCVWAIMAGYRLVMAGKWYGWIILVLSFQLNSNCIFVCGLCAVDYGWREQKGRLYLISTGALILLALWKICLPTPEDYNHIDIHLLLLRLIDFLAWPVLACIVSSYIPTRYMAVLIGCVMIPYLIVGKSPHIYDFSDWSMRHAYLLSIPLSLIMARTGNYIYLLAFLLPLEYGYWVKWERAQYELSAIESKNMMPYFPHVIFRDYEIQWLKWKETGRGSVRP